MVERKKGRGYDERTRKVEVFPQHFSMNPVRNTVAQRQFLRESNTNNKFNFVRDETNRKSYSLLQQGRSGHC